MGLNALVASPVQSAAIQKPGHLNHPLTIAGVTGNELGRFAGLLAAIIKPGDCITLHGPLGAGKTTLTQFLAAALGVDAGQYVSSPSFALLHEYSGILAIYHMDLYRLNDAIEVEEAGLLEYLDREGLVIIEWPERLGSELPENRLEIHLTPLEDGAREIVLLPHGPGWTARAKELKNISLPGNLVTVSRSRA